MAKAFRADPAFQGFNEGLPYDAKHDALHHQVNIYSDRDTPFERFAVSACLIPGSQEAFTIQYTGEPISEDGTIKRHDFSLPYGSHASQMMTEAWLKELFEALPDRCKPPDTGRVVRYIAYYGCSDNVLDYLIEKWAVNLRQQDIFGRSVVFYAASSENSGPLKCIAAKLGEQAFKEELNRKDLDGKGPLYYAMMTLSVENVQFCLQNGAKSRLHTGESMPVHWSFYRLFASVRWRHWLSTNVPKQAYSQIRMLLELFDRRKQYLDFPIYIESHRSGDLNTKHALMTMHKLLCGLETPNGHPQIPTITLESDVNEPSETEEAREDDANAINWIHIPWTNGILVYAAFQAIGEALEKRNVLTKSDFEWDKDTSSYGHHLKIFFDCFRDPPNVPGDPYLDYRAPTHYVADLGYTVKVPEYIHAVFPCLVLKSLDTFFASRQAHRKVRQKTRSRFTKKKIQAERTLDEAFYPSLSADLLNDRNLDQVSTKECKRSLKFGGTIPARTQIRAPVSGAVIIRDTRPILMVPQLWIWKVEDYVLTAFPSLEDNLTEFVEEKRRTYANYVRRTRTQDPMIFTQEASSEMWKMDNLGRNTTISEKTHPDIFIRHLIADQIDKFGRHQADGMYQSPLDIFKTGVVRVLTTADAYAKSITTQASGKHSPMQPKDVTEWQLIHDIADIRSELAMIKDILNQQEHIWDNMTAHKCKGKPDAAAKQKFKMAPRRLRTYHERLDKIDRDAERVERIVQDQLNLVRAHASMRDARASLLLGTAVIGFTIVTVIFTPLSFMASLFALPVDRLASRRQDSGEGMDPVYGSGFVGWTFASAEIVALIVTGAAVWMAFVVLRRGEEWWRESKGMVGNVINRVSGGRVRGEGWLGSLKKQDRAGRVEEEKDDHDVDDSDDDSDDDSNDEEDVGEDEEIVNSSANVDRHANWGTPGKAKDEQGVRGDGGAAPDDEGAGKTVWSTLTRRINRKRGKDLTADLEKNGST